jgi:hypothetical protein
MRSTCAYLFILTVLLFGFLDTPGSFAAGTGAKAGLSKAQTAATQWKSDAQLVQVSTLSGDANGTASTWAYLFHSPSAKRGYRVDVADGGVSRTTEVSSGVLIEPLPTEFVDGDRAMTEAKANGLKTTTGRSMLTLQVMLKGTKQHGPYWNIVGDMVSGTSTLVNATTGKFLRTQALQ